MVGGLECGVISRPGEASLSSALAPEAKLPLTNKSPLTSCTILAVIPEAIFPLAQQSDVPYVGCTQYVTGIHPL